MSWSPVQATAPLSTRAMHAASWRAGSSVIVAVLTFAIGVWLARLLPPSDFGLVAMAYMFTGLARILSDLGIPSAIVQRPDLTEGHVRTAFTVSTLLGLLLTGVLVLCAPLAMLVFPEPRVPEILTALAPMFLFTGMGNTAGALLRRALDFRGIFWVSVLSHALGFGLVSVGLASLGFGYWSLVMGMLLSPIVETALLLLRVRHPIRPRLVWSEIRDLTGIGAGFSLAELLGYGARNGDNLVIGRYLGEASLGLYTKAYALMRLPAHYLGEVFTAVMFPAFSELQDDHRRLTAAYLRSTELALLAAGPVLAGMAVAAPYLVVGLFGPNWKEAVLPLQVLAFAGVLSMGYPISANVANALGRVYAVSLRTAIFAAVILVFGFLATPWGIVGVSLAVVGAHVVMYGIMSGLALRSLGLSWRSFGRAHLPGIVVAAEVGAAALAVRLILDRLGLPDLVNLVVVVLVCAVALWAGFRNLPSRVRPDQLLAILREYSEKFPVPARRLFETLLGSVPPVSASRDGGNTGSRGRLAR